LTNNGNQERAMPAALEAEKMILGSLLAGATPVENVTAVLSPDDFAVEKHRRIMKRLVDLSEKGEIINRVTAAHALMAVNQLESVDGFSYLVDLEAESLPINLDSYIKLVNDRATLRKTIYACNLVMQRCYQGTDGAADILFEAETVLAKLSDGAHSKVNLRAPSEIIEAYPGGANGFFNPSSHKNGVASPWPSLNTTIGGFKPKQLVVIAARTSVGKSVAAAQIALWTAQHGHGTAVFSMEMAGDEILTRMICSRASVNSYDFQCGYLSRDERLKFQRAASEITKMPLWIDDSSACTIPAIQAAVRKLKADRGIDIVLVDYLGLLETTSRTENRVQEVSMLTRGLKRAARDFKIPFIVLSQLSRAAVTGGGEPELHHLRESGSIEQDADLVIFLHPLVEKSFDPAAPPPAIVDTRFIVAKHRGGPIGRCTLQLMRNFTRFDDPKGIVSERTEELWSETGVGQ
jgi:replicative DNA helicase